MAFDPVQEDCLRLILAAMEREGADPASDAAFIERASEAYRLDPATLIHTDRTDRSTSSPWRPSSQITAHPSPPPRQRPSPAVLPS